ncbi:GNAT family N-acetyltransferase [Paenilisteria rocourtiae]|uniref:GNAT family N-acetyltransferase n=2 Tax=Listeria rocourtiae TaxID=647910 RepID=UPI001414F8D7|nr:GNAT family N-acetyltransferase [Listeria rocourtiae]MBC1436016.1 GNAT family N-acetyltransferase [Listeria rocourtiae]MBC1605706.1 GNAT family N-acetyltransferase [Listeria rocourtiae]
MIAVELREIKESEIGKVKELRDYAFRVPASGGEDDFNYWVQNARRLGLFYGEHLLAQVLTYPLSVSILGERFSMGGIAYVASFPEFRNGGLITRLMTESLVRMRDAGQLVSYLSPFSIPFYRRFGYEVFTEKVELEIPSHALPDMGTVPGRVMRLTSKDGTGISVVRELYNRLALTKKSGMMMRDDAWWLRLARRGYTKEIAVYCDMNGVTMGYMLFTLDAEVFKVHEMVTLNYEAEKGLWRFIGTHGMMVDRVVAKNVGSLRDVSLAFPSPDFQKREILDFMMRIVDVEAFLSKYRFEWTDNALYLQVEDEIAPWNEGVFEIRGSFVKRVESTKEPVLAITIQALGQMLMGFARPRDLVHYEKAQGSDITVEAWEKAIPHVRSDFYDAF